MSDDKADMTDMTNMNLEPLPSDVLGALQSERGRPALPLERQRELCERIGLAVSASATTPAASGELSPPPPSPSSASPLAAPVSTSALGVKLGLALFAAGAVSGGIGGAALHAALSAPPAAPAPQAGASSVQPPPAVAPAPPSEAPALEAEPPARKPAPVPRPQASAPLAPADLDLAKELALLEVARTALARGNAAEALAALDRHAALKSSGRLSEERESLAIQALLALGRDSEARRRGEAFRRAYPSSMLLPLIDSLLSPAR